MAEGKGGRRFWGCFPFLFLLILLLGCAGSSEKGDSDEGDALQLAGVISYEGTAAGDKVVIGTFDQWPPIAAPTEIAYVDVPETGFPIAYKVTFQFPGSYFLGAFLDVDPTDGVAMNLDLDPMDFPGEVEEKFELAEEENTHDFVLVDPEDFDFWWEEK